MDLNIAYTGTIKINSTLKLFCQNFPNQKQINKKISNKTS